MKRTHQKPHKSCPFCGKTRRAGYFNACPACYPAFLLQNAAGAVLMQLGALCKGRGYRLTWEFYHGRLVIYAKAQKAVHVIDAFEEPKPKATLHNVEGRASLSLRELSYSGQPLKETLMQAVLELVKKLEQTAQEHIDGKGRVVNVAGLAVPVAGDWKNFKAPFSHKRGY